MDLISLETFLRGMETASAWSWLSMLCPLKPSLEGWKLLFPRPGPHTDTILETFLRGMETAPGGGPGGAAGEALKPSLEGWKHAAMMSMDSWSFILETFLRGMETPIMRDIMGQVRFLETFLRGMETQNLCTDPPREIVP